MKKFGRGFSLDFEALMNEVRQPPKGDEPGHRSGAAGLDLAAEGSSSSTTKSYARFNSHGSEDAFSPVDPSTPFEDGSPPIAGGMPTRMSVSRTGRCKNRSRQRLTVLQDEDFYRVGPPAPSPADETGKAAKASTAPAAAASPKTSASAEETVDFDSALNALDKSIQAPVMAANCYSF